MKFFNPTTRNLKLGLMIAGASALSATAFAADNTDALSYGYIEGDYINLDIDQPGENNIFDGDFDNGGGFGVSASLPLGESLFVFGDYSNTESDFSFVDNAGLGISGDTELKRLNLGLGFAMPMSDRTDMVLSGAYVDLDYGDFNFGASRSTRLSDLDDDPSDGYMVDARLRSQLTPNMEGSIGARYTDIESADGISIIANVMWELAPNWGLNLMVDAGDELVTYGAGLRFTF